MQDQMFIMDGFDMDLSCAHNHKDPSTQEPGEICRLCGKVIPQTGEGNGQSGEESG